MPSLQKGCNKYVKTLVLLKRDGIKIYLGLALQLPLGRTNYVLFQVTTLTRNGPWPLASQSAVLELVLIEASITISIIVLSNISIAIIPTNINPTHLSQCQSQPTFNPSNPIRSFCPSSNCRTLPPVLRLEGVTMHIVLVLTMMMTKMIMPLNMVIFFEQYYHRKLSH